VEMISSVIDGAEAAIVRAPLSTPFRIATGQHDELANVFLRLRTSDGICGYGEAAIATHITGETLTGTLENLNAVAAALPGRRIYNPEALCREFRPHFTPIIVVSFIGILLSFSPARKLERSRCVTHRLRPALFRPVGNRRQSIGCQHRRSSFRSYNIGNKRVTR